MPNVADIESAVARLSPADLAEFRAWFAKFDPAQWDTQMERDASNGRLDPFADEAIEDLRAGRATDL